MTFKNSLKTALLGLRTNKSRSFLTLLGIVIGIASIILIVSLGRGAKNLILKEIQSIGAKTIEIAPGRQPKGPTDILASFTDSLKQRDLDVLSSKENVPHLAKIMPIVYGSETIAYGNDTYKSTMFGVTDLFAKIYDMYPEEGRIFDDEEVKSASDVVVIGSKIKKELFGQNDAIGEKVKIKGKNFRVIGLLPEKGQSSFVNFNEVAIVPYTTAQQYIFGIKYFHRLVAEVDAEENIEETVEDIETTLRDAHDITDPSKDDFYVETQADAMQIVGVVTNTLTLFLVAIAAISLLVGGIGVMNIMLVSVTERTREIGLRKSLGASNKDVLLQFLLESTLLTAIGGLVGIILGALFSLLAALILSKLASINWSFVFPFSAAFIGLIVSGMVGLIFGIYPARKASLKSPIEALRYE